MKYIILMLMFAACNTFGIEKYDKNTYDSITNSLEEVSNIKDLDSIAELSLSKKNEMLKTTEGFLNYILKCSIGGFSGTYTCEEILKDANITYNFLVTCDAYDEKTKKQNLRNFAKSLNAVIFIYKKYIDQEKNGLERIKKCEFSTLQNIVTAENNFKYLKKRFNQDIKELKKIQSNARISANK